MPGSLTGAAAEDAERTPPQPHGAAPRGELADLFDARNYPEVVRRLASMTADAAERALQGCDLTQVDARGDTVWHVAADLMHGDNQLPDVMQAAAIINLLAAGADINARDAHGNTPLIRAVAPWFHRPMSTRLSVNASLLGMMANLGANPSLRNGDGHDALSVAVQRGSNRAVRQLLQRGAFVDGIAPDGTTALYHLARRSIPTAIQIGIPRWGNIPPAVHSAAGNCVHIARSLKDFGAGAWGSVPGARYDTGCAPWLEPEFQAIAALGGGGTRPSWTSSLLWALGAKLTPWLASRLQTRRPSPPSTPRSRATAMLGAIAAGTPSHAIADADLRQVVEDGHVFGDGYGVLQAAIRARQHDTVRRMLDFGANPNADAVVPGLPPGLYLSLAAATGDADTVHALLDHGARDGLPSASQFAAYNPRLLGALVHSGVHHTIPAPIASQSAAAAARTAAAFGRRDSLANLLEFLPEAALPPARFGTGRPDLVDVRDPLLRQALNAAAVFQLLASVKRRAPRIAPAPPQAIAAAFAAAYAGPEAAQAGPAPAGAPRSAPASPVSTRPPSPAAVSHGCGM